MSVLVPTPEPAAQAGRATSAVTSPPRPRSTPPTTTSAAPASARSSGSAAVPSPRAARSSAAGRVSSASTGAGARIEAHRDTTGGVIITVRGDLGRNDAALLSRQLHSALETAASVVVVNARAVAGADPCAEEVLAVARDRARVANIALHVVDPHHHLTHDR